MKLLVLTAAFVSLASAIPTNEWAQYKEKYQKVYTSTEEDLLRYNQYLKTKKMIEEHNMRYEKGETSYWMGINHFSDWFPEEINSMLGRKDKPNNTHFLMENSRGKPFELPEGTPVPDSINWVEKGAVTKVKNQLKCASYYAFSAAGALEGLMFRTNNTITDLSAQEFLDCSSYRMCRGGFMVDCFSYVKKRNGIDTSASYPYEAFPGRCRADRGVIGATCTTYEVLGNEEDLKKAVGTVGPVSIGFSVDIPFFHYKGGIFAKHCKNEINHGMLVVGYDKDKKTGQDYWLIKNSYGENWGEKGYVRVIRNRNECGLADNPSFPKMSV